MSSSASDHVLDNFVWHSLNSNHAPFAVGTPLAKRYTAGFLTLVAVAEHSEAAYHDLAELVPPGEIVALWETHPPTELPGWTIHQTLPVSHMVCEKPVPEINDATPVTELTTADLPDIVQLIELTKPGPWADRSLELGHFLGIRHEGVLIAMAGERICLTGYREISAVCTHPDHQGKGYARLLVSQLVNDDWGRGDVPFLHVAPNNTRAIRLYESLHFRERCTNEVIVISR